MNELRTERQTTFSASRLAVLITGDLLVLLLLIGWGRSHHTLSIADIGAWLFTAAPFIIGWFVVTPWFGLFRAEVNRTWQKLAPRLLLAWAIGGPLALVLRALFLGRSIPGGIIPVFALVLMGTTTTAMLVWRLVYIWWNNRYDPQTGDTREA